ncbi:MAG TPA: alpha/beta fold hydrolase [Acidimicrobiia bacterium]|nr:alpha/beta fold hydrolase [Acidimicrobiia bacterium]
MLEMVIALATAAMLVLAGLWLFQRRLIYYPVAGVPPLSATLPGARIVTISTSDGLVLTGWFLAPPTPIAAVLVLNGNAGNRADRAPLAKALVDRGYEVLVFDYRGYGGNEGSPSEEGLALDAAAAVAALAEVATVDRLILLGESLGAAVAARLAVESPPTALVLRSPFPSLAAVAAVHYSYLPTRLLLRDHYDTLQPVSMIKVPILVVAGSADSIVPTHLSRAVYEAASADAHWALIENANHNDPALSFGQPLLTAIDRFLDEEL